jgi:superfamily II DNA/RNA helicase
LWCLRHVGVGVRRGRVRWAATEAAEAAAAAAAPVAAPVAAPTFADLALAAPLQRALAGLGFERPFGVQTATLPTTLAGRDVIVRAVTGSGKTLAFVLPIVQRLAYGPGAAAAATAAPRAGAARTPRALVLAPTRELALQVQSVLATLEAAAGLRSTAVYGGASIGLQARDLRRGVDIVVGTPGRLNDFLERGDLVLDRVEVLGAPQRAAGQTGLCWLGLIR